MERFDVKIGQWSMLEASIGVGRRGMTLTYRNESLILVGGRDMDEKVHKTVQKYDPNSDA